MIQKSGVRLAPSIKLRKLLPTPAYIIQCFYQLNFDHEIKKSHFTFINWGNNVLVFLEKHSKKIKHIELKKLVIIYDRKKHKNIPSVPLELLTFDDVL
jgi:hypothetical protein